MISTHYAIVAFGLVVFTLIASPSSQSLMSQRSVKSILQLAARVNSSKPTKQYQTMIRCVQNKHGVSCSLFTFQASDKTGGASSKSKISTYFAFRISLVNITVMLACTSIIRQYKQYQIVQNPWFSAGFQKSHLSNKQKLEFFH